MQMVNAYSQQFLPSTQFVWNRLVITAWCHRSIAKIGIGNTLASVWWCIFIRYTKTTGAPSKPIRLMVGLLILKQLENLSDEAVVFQWKHKVRTISFFVAWGNFNVEFLASTELVHLRKRIDSEGVERIFRMSFGLHGKVALEETVHIDTTVQEKNTTYSTDSKLAIKIISRLNKLARVHGI